MSVLETIIGWVAPPQCINCGREGLALCLGCSASEIVPYGEQCWLCNALSPGGRTCVKCCVGVSPRFVWITGDYTFIASTERKGAIMLKLVKNTKMAIIKDETT